VRTFVTIGVCGAILAAASACTTCSTPPVNASIRAGSNTVGFGYRAGAPNIVSPGYVRKQAETIRITAFVLAGSVPKMQRAQRRIPMAFPLSAPRPILLLTQKQG
jgi:hypothetical protein